MRYAVMQMRYLMVKFQPYLRKVRERYLTRTIQAFKISVQGYNRH